MPIEGSRPVGDLTKRSNYEAAKQHTTQLGWVKNIKDKLRREKLCENELYKPKSKLLQYSSCMTL